MKLTYELSDTVKDHAVLMADELLEFVTAVHALAEAADSTFLCQSVDEINKELTEIMNVSSLIVALLGVARELTEEVANATIVLNEKANAANGVHVVPLIREGVKMPPNLVQAIKQSAEEKS